MYMVGVILENYCTPLLKLLHNILKNIFICYLLMYIRTIMI